jgi:hypothetical protein
VVESTSDVNRSMYRWILSLLPVLLPGCTIRESIVIDAPVAKVWSYVTESENAREWSVYVHHISPLPGVGDGEVGSIRRCFRTRAETDGVWWDEVILEVRPLRYRRILSYNAHGFPDPTLNSGEFYVHQSYEAVSPARTRLTFSAEQLRPSGPLMRARFYRAAREGKPVFALNLQNIKAAIEARHERRPYHRIHPYLNPVNTSSRLHATGRHSSDPAGSVQPRRAIVSGRVSSRGCAQPEPGHSTGGVGSC